MEEQAWYLDTPLCSFTNLFLQREQVNGLSLVWVCSCCLISAALMNLFSWLELLCWIVFIWTFVPLHSICRSDPNYDNNDKFSQMQATWWTRLDVKIPSFCLFMNIFLQWKQLNSLSWCELVHTESILLHQRISFHNMSSWMVFTSRRLSHRLVSVKKKELLLFGLVASLFALFWIQILLAICACNLCL